MLKSLQLDHFTVFQRARLTFGRNLNVIVGENGTGKSHILKAAYSGIAASATSQNGWGSGGWGEGTWGGSAARDLTAKLRGVFRPDGIGRLVRRGSEKCRMSFHFEETDFDLDFSITASEGDQEALTIQKAPRRGFEKRPVFLPTRELLTIYQNFVSLYETTRLPFEETWRDTCILLGAPSVRGERERRIGDLLAPLELAMGGRITLEDSGRFYLHLPNGPMEMHLVAEGLRKLATVAQLIANASLLDDGYLFWDEPEANLNPKIMKLLARTIFQVARSGIQVFVATHSLFLLRELHILQQTELSARDVRYFGLHSRKSMGVKVDQGGTLDEIGDISALDEDLQQSDRYMKAEMSLAADQE